MPWKDVNHQALLRGKGYEPDYKTEDKDLIVPEVEHEEPKSWPTKEEADVGLCELLSQPEEPDRRPKGMPRAWGKKWAPEALPAPPAGWSPKR